MMEAKPSTEAPIAESSPASLRGVYLDRLKRLLRLRHEHEEELNEQGLRLLDRAIFAAYCACRDVDVEKQARDVLREANITLREPIGGLELPEGEFGPQPTPSSEPTPRAEAER